MAAVPLLHAGQPVGTLLVLAQATNAFDDADVRTLELLSVVISAAMSHAAEFEALNRFRTVFEGASVGMVRARADGSAREVNEAILKMLGYTPEDHSTRSFDLFTHPDDLERTKELMGQLMAERARLLPVREALPPQGRRGHLVPRERLERRRVEATRAGRSR